MIRDARIRMKKNSMRAMNLQAHIDRLIQGLQQEMLDHFIVIRTMRFDFLVAEHVDHCHMERPHQSKGNVPLTGEWAESHSEPPDSDEVACRYRLVGVLKHYYCEAE